MRVIDQHSIDKDAVIFLNIFMYTLSTIHSPIWLQPFPCVISLAHYAWFIILCALLL